MGIGADFKQIGTLDAGELVLKLPGTDIKMPYKSGRAFLSDSGVGHVALAVQDIYCEETDDEAEGFMGFLGEQITPLINDPSLKAIIKKTLSERDVSLFYSQDQGGVEILSIPGLSREDGIDDQIIPNMVVASYNTEGEIQNAEKVYALHMEAVGNRRLITDRSTLEREVLQLVPKANGVYEKVLEAMKISPL